MSNELIAIFGVAATLAGLIIYGQYNTKSDIQNLRSDMRAEFKAVREETQAEFNIHLAAINGLREDVSQLYVRVARQEGLMDGLREAIVGLRDALTGTPDRVAGPGARPPA